MAAARPVAWQFVGISALEGPQSANCIRFEIYSNIISLLLRKCIPC